MNVKEKPTAKSQFEDILFDVSWADISRTYFGKSSSWIYNKLNGIDGNGGIGEFSPEEKEILKGALYDISERLRKAADNFK